MGTRSSTRAVAAKEKAYAHACLTKDKPKAIDRPLQYSAGIRLSFGMCKNILVYKIFDYWYCVKEVKRDIKKVRLGIVLNRTTIIIKF